VAASGETAAALDAHRSDVAAETLATDLVDGEVPNAAYRQDAEIDGASLTLTLRRA
jgi:hypothetical protein